MIRCPHCSQELTAKVVFEQITDDELKSERGRRNNAKRKSPVGNAVYYGKHRIIHHYDDSGKPVGYTDDPACKCRACVLKRLQEPSAV